MNFGKADIRLITDEKLRLYYLGFAATDGYVILEKGKTIFVVDRRYYYAAQKRLAKKGIEVICGADYEPLKEEIAKIGAKVVGIDYGTTSLKLFGALRLALPSVEFIDCGDDIVKEASIKTEEELETIAKACAIAEKSFKETLPLLKAGVTESEVAAELEYRFKQNGASDKSFDTIVAFGANSAVPHHETGNTVLKEGMAVLMDFGCIYKGYCSDMTRTMFFGEPDPKFLRAYKAVYEAHFAALDNVKAGMTGKQADETARGVLRNYGYAEYFTHSLGHGIGVHIHEYPFLAPSRDNVLYENMVFSDEPGVYFDGKFGIRIEDSCHLTAEGLKTFMKDDKRLIVIKNGKITKRNIRVKD